MRTTHVDRPQYKFSAAHMTVFSDGRKERLHGHNYQVAARLYLCEVSPSPSVICDFAAIKEGLRRVCDELNERTLVALHNPFLVVSVDEAQGGQRVRLSHRDGEYLLPLADVALLPVDNISSERLAEHCHERLASYLRQVLPPSVRAAISELEVQVEELPGQGASYRAELGA